MTTPPDTARRLTLPPGSATGLGSMPGTDILETTRMVVELLPDLPFLPELPARGPGGDMVGRAVHLLADLHGDVQPAGWRLVPGAGRDERLAASWLGEDLDALEEVAGSFDGVLKLQVCGPVTLASTVELFRGGLAARDPGARRDIAASLAEGVLQHVAEVRRRLPAARVVLQVDEPVLPTALLGRLPTQSGWGSLRALEVSEAESALRQVVQASGVPVVLHCCAPSPPVRLFLRAGASGISLDAMLLGERDDEVLGETVDAGVQLLLGVVPTVDTTSDPALSGPAATVRPVVGLWRRLGFAPGLLAQAVTVTPTCGLAAASPAYARRALAAARAAGAALVDDPEG